MSPKKTGENCDKRALHTRTPKRQSLIYTNYKAQIFSNYLKTISKIK